MIFQDNVIKEYLRNVYFITGTPCGGKTTISRELAKRHNHHQRRINCANTGDHLQRSYEHSRNSFPQARLAAVNAKRNSLEYADA